MVEVALALIELGSLDNSEAACTIWVLWATSTATAAAGDEAVATPW